MKHLSNICDPKGPDAKSYIISLDGQTSAEAWESQRRWLSDKVIGRPKATEAYTAKELEAMGIVGVYLPLTE